MERFAIKRRITTAAGVRYEAVDQTNWLAVRMMRIPENGTSDELDVRVYEKLQPLLPTIRHINIAPVIDLNQDEDGAYAAYAQLEGETLIDWLRMHGVMTVDDAIIVAKSCLAGLSALHDQKVLHGDVSPARILITRDATLTIQVTMIEPGLALLVKSGQGETPGTPMVGRDVSFTAPEVIQREVINTRSDLYSLGVTLYYCLTGYLPFNGETAQEIARAHVDSTAAPLDRFRADLPQALQDLIMQLIARDYRQRPVSAAAAAEMLEPKIRTTIPIVVPVKSTMLAGASPLASAAPPYMRSAQPSSFKWVWIAIGIAIPAIASAIWVLNRKPSAPVKATPSAIVAAADAYVKARFLRIESRNGKPLSIVEIEAFSQGKNLALKKPATQSSIDYDGLASRANDGNTAATYVSESTSHTKGGEELAWWECDLGKDETIEMVRVWNRAEKQDKENLPSRLDGFQLVLLDSSRREIFRSNPTKGPEISVEFSLKQTITTDSKR